jgi:hypothetical protein
MEPLSLSPIAGQDWKAVEVLAHPAWRPRQLRRRCRRCDAARRGQETAGVTAKLLVETLEGGDAEC